MEQRFLGYPLHSVDAIPTELSRYFSAFPVFETNIVVLEVTFQMFFSYVKMDTPNCQV
jgi:hypothetical protein